MRLELTGRHITVTPAIRRLIEQRLAPMLRLLNDSAVSAQVVLRKEKTRVHAEVTLHARGEHFLHGEATGRDVDTALSAAADKVDRQVRSLKSRWSKGKRQGVSAAKAASASPRPARGARAFGGARAAAAEPRGLRIVRARRYEVKPMSVDEAALEVVDGADAFLVFRNAATDTINVLFRRSDGNLGLIEPEA
ncbi:MAG TPA: ribosome-associated translation inhibitor RaiA [Vicinamibacterales bacterium]|jgi:putative sigma-54 modulation protein|nr:ribosome-associated translation inhibitor RaiA [Vicinamibacterales bacterium]